MKTKLIVNPTSGRGRLIKRWPEIQEALKAERFEYDAVLTERRGHATELARAALDAGFDLIVAVGGDGTLNEVANGLLANGKPVNPAAVLGVISSGTGSDLVRTIGLPRDVISAARHLAHATGSCWLDIGEMTYGVEGKEVRRCFCNVAGMGFDAEVVDRVERNGKRGGGTLPYLAALVSTVSSYKNKDVRLEIDGDCHQGRMNSVVVCNGQYFGGGMRIGPNALVDDGLFDVIVLGDFSTAEVLANTPKIYSGAHLALDKVSEYRGRCVRVEAAQRMLIQADGEAIGPGPTTFTLLPRAIALRV